MFIQKQMGGNNVWRIVYFVKNQVTKSVLLGSTSLDKYHIKQNNVRVKKFSLGDALGCDILLNTVPFRLW